VRRSQPWHGRFVGKPGTPTGVTAEGPALKGATNLVFGAVDHRETAFHQRTFREIYKFIAGREPSRIEIHDVAASGGRGRSPRGGGVQPGTDRGAGLAGGGKPDCGGRADLLAVAG
jgi:hypothetical protein